MNEQWCFMMHFWEPRGTKNLRTFDLCPQPFKTRLFYYFHINTTHRLSTRAHMCIVLSVGPLHVVTCTSNLRSSMVRRPSKSLCHWSNGQVRKGWTASPCLQTRGMCSTLPRNRAEIFVATPFCWTASRWVKAEDHKPILRRRGRMGSVVSTRPRRVAPCMKSDFGVIVLF